ncbi:MAG: UPF0147 family protein [Candidatus Woesearchaeota archaeon]|jgi:hypothetical protein
MIDQRILSVISSLQEIANENAVPRNVKEKLTQIITTLKNEKEDFLMRKDKALSELDEVVEDTNLQPYTRTQIWNIVSALEMI